LVLRLGSNDFSSNSIIGCNDAERVGPLTLMCGTGIPAGVVPQAIAGVADNRVLLIDPSAESSGNTASSA
jgi:hypothetical protein